MTARSKAVQPEDDARFMAAAIRLSRWHLGMTGANPSVGCLIVRDGIIVGRGVTAVSGRPHAETIALADAGEAAHGATAYITLEPCSHHGHTPPCAEALVAAGIARVVVALTDPDSRVSGRGLAILERAGVEVVSDVLAAEAEVQLAAYLKRQRSKRPQVILKLAVSADGMIGRRGAGQVAITGPAARAQSHILRAESDAILIGIGTALADDPELTCRLPGMESRSPVRIVLDRRLKLPISAKLVGGIAGGFPLWLIAGESADQQKRAALVGKGAKILDLAAPDHLPMLQALAARGISSLIVEGGARVVTAFLAQGLVDRIVLFTSPVTIGEGGITTPVSESSIPKGFSLQQREQLGEDRMDDYVRSKEI